MTDGLVVVDKPAGWTSHDVVARIRRLAGLRRVGHAGTLDPMATGVLVVGLGRATRLLGHLAVHDKEYAATVRLGVTTSTDDAEGEITCTAGGEAVAAITDAAIAAQLRSLTGEIQQVPSAVSAIKVDGRRAYARVRAGEQVDLAARPVAVRAFELLRRRGDELDVTVTCSTGTYIRALARDLGAALGVGAHLTALRRTRVGGFTLDQARRLEQLEAALEPLSLAAAVDSCFPRLDLTAEQAGQLSHGQRLPLAVPGDGPVGAFAPDGSVIALVEATDGVARPLCVFR